MNSKPLVPVGSMSGTGAATTDDSSSIISTSTASSGSKDVARRIWTETQWTNLSVQAKKLGLSKLPYFDPKTMLLSKEVNGRLWRQLLRLYDHLGAEQAQYASPVMVEGGEVKWYSYMGESKGQEADVFDYERKKQKPEKRWLQDASLGKEREHYHSGLQR